MNTKEIDSVLRRNPVTKASFVGVFARNRLPARINRLPSHYVVNTHTASGSGEHWLAIYFDSNGKASYFDSYGEKPRHPDIIRFLRTNAKGYQYNREKIQGNLSFTCGHHVVAFLFLRSSGVSHSTAINKLGSGSANHNDAVACALTCKLMKHSSRFKSSCTKYCNRYL